MDKTLETYDISTEFPRVWNESEETLKGPASEVTSKNALINQLITNLKSTNTRSTNDEADPLSRGKSVLETMKQHGVDPHSLPADLGTYLPSSTYFNARQYLAVVHQGSSFQELEHKLEYLKSSINKRTKQQVNLGEDFEQFVTSKQQLDDILANVSGQASDGLDMNRFTDQLEEALRSYTLLMRPLEDNGIVKDRYLNALSLAKTYKYVLELPKALEEHVKNREHLDFVRDWRTGRDYLHEMRESSKSADCERIAGQVAEKVNAIVIDYRAWVWKQLMFSQADKMYSKYLEMLVDLEVEQNPLYEWINHQVQFIHNKIRDFFEQHKVNSHNYDKSEPAEVTLFIPKIGAGAALDSSDVLEQWEILQQFFVELHELVNKATTFWKECALIFGGRKQVASLRLTGGQETELRQKFTGIIGELAQLLAAFLGAGGTSSSSRSGSGERSFLPSLANSLSSAKYLNSINRVLVEIDEELMASTFSQSVQQIQVAMSKTIANSWLRDSAKLGNLQQLGKSPNLNEAVAQILLYHRTVLNQLIHLGPVSSEVVQSALAVTVKSFYEYLKSSISNQVDDLTPQYISEEEKLLMTINNISGLDVQVIPEIWQNYSQLTGVAVPEAQQRALSQTADDLCRELFDHYTKTLDSRITRVVKETNVSQWTQESATPTNVSQSALEALMVLVEIHAKFSVHCPRFLVPALSALYSSILASMLRVVREFDALGRTGALQVYADLEFLSRVMRSVHSSQDQRIVVQIREFVQGLCPRAQAGEMSGLVDEVMDSERLAFACFR